MTFAHELALLLFIVIALVTAAALISKQREKVRNARNARLAPQIEAAMRRHPAGNRR